jgi:hypothetical protein
MCTARSQEDTIGREKQVLMVGTSASLSRAQSCWTQWLMPVILATSEAETRKIMV